MVKLIQDLWIQKEDGIVLFSRVFHKQVEDQLFGALMSALHSFAEQLSEDGLTNFELSQKKFTLLKKRGLLFICNTDNKVKDKKVSEELENVSEKFLACYPESTSDDWDGDVSCFQEFGDQIQSALEDPIKKFWDGF